MAVETHNLGEDGRDRLWRVELPRFLARISGKLIDEVLIGIAQRIGSGRELGNAFGYLGDDGAELGIAICVGAPQFFGI